MAVKEPKFPTRKIEKAMKGCKDVNRIIKKLCGELIGKGVFRDVYVLKQDPNFVVKIERDVSTGMFCNVTEFRHYINNKEWKWFEKYLASCELINETGQVMIQRRANWEGKKKKDYPKRIPAIFTDTKYMNFGWIGNRFVCIDYAFIPVYFIVNGKDKMKTPKWWGPLEN